MIVNRFFIKQLRPLSTISSQQTLDDTYILQICVIIMCIALCLRFIDVHLKELHVYKHPQSKSNCGSKLVVSAYLIRLCDFRCYYTQKNKHCLSYFTCRLPATQEEMAHPRLRSGRSTVCLFDSSFNQMWIIDLLIKRYNLGKLPTLFSSANSNKDTEN